MELIRTLQQLSSALTAIAQLGTSVVQLAKTAPRLLSMLGPSVSYRNIALSLELDICDPEGQLAILRRTQTVEFRTSDAGVVRELLWGEGRRDPEGRAVGAQSMNVGREGGREVHLLSTNPPPAKGERRRIATERVVHGALLSADEYLEALTERPTSLLKLRVLFPEGRFAVDARAEMSPARSKLRPVRPRINKDGRASLSWTIRNPQELATYRLAWHW